eukprot:scaffold9313_cov131-Skeletonema_marinoi.AAC.1
MAELILSATSCPCGICVEHFLGEIAHDGFSRKVKVTQHFIRPPAAKKLNDISVHFGDEERHGTASSEGAGGDLLGCEAQAKAKAEEAHGAAQVGGDQPSGPQTVSVAFIGGHGGALLTL